MTFFNIFSAKKHEEEKITLIADYREKNSLVIAELIKMKCVVHFEQLGIADYLVKGVAVERKTVSDFKMSIIDKRLVNQLIQLKKYEKKVLLIEGIKSTMYEGTIHQNALRGFIWAVALDYEVPLVYTLDEEDTARYLCILANRKSKEHHSLRYVPSPLSDKERLQFVMEGFPGIGPASAKKLLGRFRTLKGVLDAPQKVLEETIGKKAREVIRLREKEYHEPE